ncbi:hypothetical protein [Spiribacter onubensis]|uniref:Uncharacterized protein n=1 Tax=Spiribacter onubensis TaxID=3122420 RepID=A0ABV3S7E2_9GAMM
MTDKTRYRFDDLKAACAPDWRAYIQHDFVARLEIDFWAMGLERRD